MSLVLALDIATTSGAAWGRVDAVAPSCATVRFGNVRMPAPEIFGNAVEWFTTFMSTLKPDIVLVEALLPPDAMRGDTTRQVRDRLCGLQAIALGVAHNTGAGEIVIATVGDIRQHFINTRGLRRDRAKAAVMDQCRVLGWTVANDNEGDAAAAWSYATALIDPRLAMRTSPLFKRIASVWP
jgi:hypothetical protein